MLLRLPQLQAKNISFSGLKTFFADELQESVRQEISGSYGLIIPKQSIFLIRGKTLEQGLLKNFPRLKTVEISRRFPDTLAIVVEERDLWAILCNDGYTPENTEDLSCLYLDQTGFAFEEAPYSVGSLILKVRTDYPEINPGRQILAPETAKGIERLQEQAQEAGIRAWRYELFGQVPSEIKMETDEGFALFFLREDDFANAFRVLKTLLEREIKDKRKALEYIDLRFGNKAFYRLKN